MASKSTKPSNEKYEQICTEVDRLFDLYGNKTDNCIVLGVYYDSEERRTTTWQKGHEYICESPLALAVAGDFRYFSDCYDWDYKYNPYVRPIMHDVSAFTVINDDDYGDYEDDEESSRFVLKNGMLVHPISQRHIQWKDVDKIPDANQVEKLRDFYNDAETLVKLAKPVMHSLCGKASEFCDESTNCFWRNYIVIGRDYKFRTFTMHYDAMMKDESIKFDDMIIDDTLSKINHVKQNFKPVKDYGPSTNVAIREPVAFPEWPDWEKHIIDARKKRGHSYWEPTIQVDSINNIPFAQKKLKELPICMITDIFLQYYDRGSDQKLSNFYYYSPENTDEKIYNSCQNSVYKYDYFGMHQIAFNWYTLCCLHGDTDSHNKKSTKIVSTYIGDMTPIEFINFIRTTFWNENKEYTGDKDLLFYGLRIKKVKKDWKQFGPSQDGTNYSWGSHELWGDKPWCITVQQYNTVYKKIMGHDL